MRSLPGLEVRPTLDRVREAVFSSLGPRVDGARFLDLFAGSGAVGIEALSRGALEAVFIESSKPCRCILQQNLETCGLSDRARLIEADWKTAVDRLRRSRESFDIAYVDPPYDRLAEEPILVAAGELLAPGGELLLEHRLRKTPPARPGGLLRVRTTRYGQTAISWYACDKGVVDTPVCPP